MGRNDILLPGISDSGFAVGGIIRKRCTYYLFWQQKACRRDEGIGCSRLRVHYVQHVVEERGQGLALGMGEIGIEAGEEAAAIDALFVFAFDVLAVEAGKQLGRRFRGVDAFRAVGLGGQGVSDCRREDRGVAEQPGLQFMDGEVLPEFWRSDFLFQELTQVGAFCLGCCAVCGMLFAP